jgi:hypothetical protein
MQYNKQFKKHLVKEMEQDFCGELNRKPFPFDRKFGIREYCSCFFQ